MERRSRPEARPGYPTRVLVAAGLSTWTALQALTMVVAAVRGGPTQDALTFFVTGILTLYLAAASWLAWLWAGRARPRSFAIDEDAAGPHPGISGEIEPPARW